MMQAASATSSGAVHKSKIPPFLKKLVDLTNSCPPHIGGWNDDGTQFIVRSSQFADLLREQFQGSLQTFVRQLHFYSFNKKDDGPKGIWMFSHPNFVRGQSHLLVHIERKSNPKKKGGKEEVEDSEVYHHPTARGLSDSQLSSSSASYSGAEKISAAALEARLFQMERKLDRITSLEQEVNILKQELVAFKELAAAQNLLSLAPEISKKRMAKEDPSKEKDEPYVKIEKEDPLLQLQPPNKVTRLTSVDSLIDFPFEDTSSLGSVSMKDLLREIQTDIFSDFEEFLPAAPRQTSVQASVQLKPVSTIVEQDVESKTGQFCGKDKEEMFKIPSGFELQPGVTITLLKQAFCVIAKMCCPNRGTGECAEVLRKLCDEHPHPSTLPPVESCPINRELLPILRENVTEEATDLELMRASRQVYEVYYHTMIKKLQDKRETPGSASGSPEATASGIAMKCPSAPSSQ
jgi:hypothetical protein